MYKKIALLLLSAVISGNNITANSDRVDNTQESSYNEFVQDYSRLFDEEPGKEWNVRLFECNGGGGKCGGGACGSCGSY